MSHLPNGLGNGVTSQEVQGDASEASSSPPESMHPQQVGAMESVTNAAAAEGGHEQPHSLRGQPENRIESGAVPDAHGRPVAPVDGDSACTSKAPPPQRVLSTRRTSLNAAQFRHIFEFLDGSVHQLEDRHRKRIQAATCPAAREAVEWLANGFPLDVHSQILLRWKTGGGRNVVERQLRIFSHHFPPLLAAARWWIRRQPQPPTILRASALQGRAVIDAETFDGISGLDLSGSSSVLDIQMDASLESLSYVNFNGCERLLFLPSFGQAGNLRTVVLTSSAVLDVSPLSACVYLEQIDLTWCKNLSNLGGLSSMQYLRKLVAAHSALVDISALAGCGMLEEVILSDCADLVDISALASCRALRTLDLTGTAVHDMTPLCKLRALEELLLIDCKALTEYHEVRSLVSLTAQHSGIRTVVSEHQHECLALASFNDCRLLTSLSFFAGSHNLRRLTATFTAIDNVEGLGTCAFLEEVDFSHCIFLRNVEGLRYAPRLSRVMLAFSAVTSVDALGQCRALEMLDVSACKNLRDISPLNGLPELRSLTVKTSAVEGVARHCPKLTSLNLAGCKSITDLSFLADESPRLVKLEASRCGVTDISFLSRMLCLETVRFDNCPLSDPSLLTALHPRMQTQ